MTAGPERYIAAEPALLEALKTLVSEQEADQMSRGIAQLLIRVAHYDPEEGRLVLGLRLIRELEDPPPDQGFGSI